MFARVPWARSWAEALNQNAHIAQFRGRFEIPYLNLATTFRVILTAYTSGSITVKLRVGFQNADADASPHGVDFPPLTVLNSSSLASVVFDPAAVLPGVIGSPPGILPPLITVLIDTDDATILTYEVFTTCLSPD